MESDTLVIVGSKTDEYVDIWMLQNARKAAALRFGEERVMSVIQRYVNCNDPKYAGVDGLGNVPVKNYDSLYVELTADVLR